MSLTSDRFFQPNCSEWKGYKPCDIQKEFDRQDCFGCDRYIPIGAELDDVEEGSVKERLLGAYSVGLIEMGGLGSILRTTAVTKELRRINPRARTTWYTHERGVELLKNVPSVDHIVNISDGNCVSYEHDIMLNFELNDKIIDLVRCQWRIGGFTVTPSGKFYGATSEAQYMQRLQVDDNFRKQNRLSMQAILLKTVGFDFGEDSGYDFVLTDENAKNAEKVLSELFDSRVPEKIIGINIGTSEKGHLRRWPVEKCMQLATLINQANREIGVLILNGPDDSKVLAKAKEIPHDTSTKFTPSNMSVGDFIGIVSNLTMVVTPDTFVFHAAKSCHIPTVVVANPMPASELEVEAGDIVIGGNVECGPCYHKCNKQIYGECMQNISPEQVFSSIKEMLVI